MNIRKPSKSHKLVDVKLVKEMLVEQILRLPDEIFKHEILFNDFFEGKTNDDFESGKENIQCLLSKIHVIKLYNDVQLEFQSKRLRKKITSKK